MRTISPDHLWHSASTAGVNNCKLPLGPVEKRMSSSSTDSGVASTFKNMQEKARINHGPQTDRLRVLGEQHSIRRATKTSNGVVRFSGGTSLKYQSQSKMGPYHLSPLYPRGKVHEAGKRSVIYFLLSKPRVRKTGVVLTRKPQEYIGEFGNHIRKVPKLQDVKLVKPERGKKFRGFSRFAAKAAERYARGVFPDEETSGKIRARWIPQG
ncbi:hypothetical protein BDZ97DRAFT_1753886 [Flammula alnicola]|nr:hypothetical protein BDZ97DRAFT_1753886 [Flammula alnicola]